MTTSLALTSNWKLTEDFSLHCLNSCFLSAVYNMDNISVKSYMKNTQPMLYELLQHLIVTFSDTQKRKEYKNYFTKQTYKWLKGLKSTMKSK